MDLGQESHTKPIFNEDSNSSIQEGPGSEKTGDRKAGRKVATFFHT